MPLHAPRGPISLTGGVRKEEQLEVVPVVALRIVAYSPGTAAAKHLSVGLVSQKGTAAALAPWLAPTCVLGLEGGSDCTVTVKGDSAVPEGCLVLDPVQQYNLRCAVGEVMQFEVLPPPPPSMRFALTDVDVEVRLLNRPAMGQEVPPPFHVEAAAVAESLAKSRFSQVVSTNQMVVLELTGTRLGAPCREEVLLRFSSTHNLNEEARMEEVAYHCFRGLLTPDTAIYITEASSDDGVGGGLGEGGRGQNVLRGTCGVVLLNCRTRLQSPPPKNEIRVNTNDGEWFPVKKQLLRQCIALTKVIRDEGSSAAAEVGVDIDTLTFDRVLIFLEAEVQGLPAPEFDINHLEELLDAANKLDLRSLRDWCQGVRGEFEARLREYTFEEVKKRNAGGELLLLVDGMVLDVTRWLPEHPGGSKIIPAQALNVEAARMFEVYHSSRESFLYLKHFYLGELRGMDRGVVPEEEPPSADFLMQLRELCAGKASAQSHSLAPPFLPEAIP